MRAARNRALDHVKRRRVEAKWRAREEREQQQALEEQVSDHHHGLHSGGDQDWRLLVERALARLPERRRQVLMLRWTEGLSYEQIAARLEISVKTVDNQIGRGLKTLRAELKRSA
jgi:RNA polymerase sigma-70 factor (ECF subfamily)